MQRRSTVVAFVAVALMGAVTLPAAQADVPCNAGNGRLEGGTWSQPGGDLAASRNQTEEDAIDPAAAATLEPAWAVHVSEGGGTATINSTPTVARGCVFVTSAAGDIVALDADTGTIQWTTHYTVAVPGLGDSIVSAAAVGGSTVYTLINEKADGNGSGPYAVALDIHTGAERWRSAPMETWPASYTNASAVVIPSAGGDVIFAGWSPAEGDSEGQGGFVLYDAETGDTLVKTTTIPAADQAQGYAGGGIWAPPAYDETTGFAYVGASNPYSKTKEHPNTNSVLKIDVGDRSSATFGQIVGAYKGVPDQYSEELTALSNSPVCIVSEEVPDEAYALDDPACGQLDLDFGAPVNLFHVGDRTLVAALQKAGIVHVFDAATLQVVSSAIVGAPCAACNAAATAVGPTGVAGVSAPGGLAFNMEPLTGEVTWLSPIADGSHYIGVTLADGVFYTADNAGFLDVLDAATGDVIARTPLAVATQQPMASFSSAGIAVANHTVYVAATAASAPLAGWVVAYRPAAA